MINSKIILTRSSKFKTDKANSNNNSNIINTLLLAASALNENETINNNSDEYSTDSL